MIYRGTFKDINETEYTIKITTNGDTSSTKQIILGATPIVTEIETSDKHIYKPLKLSSATIKILSSDYMFDVYSETAQQNKVELLKGSTIKWVGYTTPNLYSMGYENEFEEIEIEAIDGLSTLQYYKYDRGKSIVKIIDIIDYLIGKCNCYTNYYISDNIQLSETTKECLLSKVEISEQNFYDEDGEPMDCKEVLEEICKYFNLSCISNGSNIYFLDYDAIKGGNNNYYKYSVGNTTGTLVNLSHSKEIKGTDYASNGGQISLDNVYNKVTVVDSLYSFDSVIPSIWDDKYLALYLTMDFSNNFHYYEEVNEDGKAGKHKCFFKYYSNSNYKCYYYDKQHNPLTIPMAVTYNFTQIYVGATICKAFFKKVNSYDEPISQIDYTNYLLLHTHNTTDTTTSLPVFELTVNDVTPPSFIGGKNVYLLIKGNFLMMDRESEMYIMQGYTQKDDNFNKDNLWIKAKLMYGSKYWNGSNWQSSECTFKLKFDNNGQTDHCINQSFPTLNTVTWDMGLDETGYAIPLPTDEVLTGKPKFTLYAPHKFDNSYRCDAVWLSDFDIKAVVATFEVDKDNESDTEYSNVINTSFVNEMEDEEFKICTWDNKEANYSAVAYFNGTNYKYLDTVYNKTTKQYLRLEEHFIYRLVNQYSTPSIILNLNLNNDIEIYSTVTDKWVDGRTFIVDSLSIDWINNLSNIKLIEKK